MSLAQAQASVSHMSQTNQVCANNGVFPPVRCQHEDYLCQGGYCVQKIKSLFSNHFCRKSKRQWRFSKQVFFHPVLGFSWLEKRFWAKFCFGPAFKSASACRKKTKQTVGHFFELCKLQKKLLFFYCFQNTRFKKIRCIYKNLIHPPRKKNPIPPYL